MCHIRTAKLRRKQILMDKKKSTNGSSGYSERSTGAIKIDDSTVKKIYK